MIIGLNLYNLHPGAGGINHYTLTLIRHWNDFSPEDKLILFCFEHNKVILNEIEKNDGLEFRFLTTQEEIETEIESQAVEVFFCPLQSYFPRPLPIPTVVTCHDIQERFFPENFTPEDIESRLHHYDWSIRMADKVVTVSNFTKLSCNKILGTKPEKLVAIHHTPDVLPRPETPKDWPFVQYEDFFYYPANDWAHKNHDRVLELAEQLARDGSDLKIVLSGFSHRGENWWQEQISRRGLSNTLFHLSHVSRPEVSWLYQNSVCLFFPSLFEGGGIPLIEAMSAGCAIACSALPAIRELASEDALYFDPHDIKSMLSALLSLKANESLRGSLAARGKARAKTFNYERQIKDHRKAIVEAVERFHILKYWIRKKWWQPQSEKSLRKTVPEAQMSAAQKLLSIDRSALTENHDSTGKADPETSSKTINPRDFAKVVKSLEYLPFDSLPQVEGREELLLKQSGTGVAAAFYIVRFLQSSLGIEGDICEFGVANGASTALIANEIKPTDKRLWLFDTFEGLPAPTKEDLLIDDIFNFGSIEKYEGQMAHDESEVIQKLDSIRYPADRYSIIKGKVEYTLKGDPLPGKVAFANVDLDFYSGVKHALDFLHQCLVPGGSVVVDDYDFFSAGAKTAVEDFICEHSRDYEFHLPQAQFGAFCILKKLI